MFFNSKSKFIAETKLSFGNLKNDIYDFDNIRSFFENNNPSKFFQKISDKTCNDLDFEAFFMYIDRTHSKVGQQYLYNKVRTIPLKNSENEQTEKIIGKLIKNESLRIEAQWNLSKLNNDKAFFINSLFQNPFIQPPKYYFIFKYLSVASILSLILLPWNPSMFFLLIILFSINLGIHYWNKKNLHKYLGSLPQLKLLKDTAVIFSLNKIFLELNPNINESFKSLKSTNKIISFFNFDLKFSGDLGALVQWILELVKILFLLEPILLHTALGLLEKKRIDVETIFNFVGEIDSLISIASLRVGCKEFCNPKIVQKKEIKATNIYHPLILNCVSNNFYIEKKSTLLTGTNMSGKTSFIRTIGLNIISGLTLNTCFAKEFSFPRTRIYSAIKISDDLLNDKSYYFEEVLTIKNLITKSEENFPNLFLLDELYKGTNTIERISAGKAVLSYLSKKENIVFASTHDIELTDLLHEEFDLYHFSELIQGNKIDFDYKLKLGKLNTRNAIRILEINNYPTEITEEANRIVQKLNIS